SQSDAAPVETPTGATTPTHWPWVLLGSVSVLFHLGLIFYGLTPALVSRPLHMALIVPWVLVFTARSRGQRISGLVLSVLAVAACVWIALNQQALADQYGFIDSPWQMTMGGLLIVVVLE